MTERSTHDIERDVEDQRAALEDTIGAIRTKLSTGHLIDTLARSLTSGGEASPFMANLNRQVRDNPIPVALAGVGIGWLILRSMQSGEPEAPAPRALPAPATYYDVDRYHTDERDAGTDVAIARLTSGAYDLPAIDRHSYDSARYADDEAAHGVPYAVERLMAGAYAVDAGARDAGAKVYDRAKASADEAKHGARYVADQLKAGAYAVQDNASAVASAAYDRARIAADHARHGAQYAADQLRAGAQSAGEAGRKAQKTAVDFVSEQPLIAGAIGVAIGAAIGAALPATRQEDALMGKHRDRLRDDAASVATEAATEAARTAERVASETLRPKEDVSA
ncbi:MAG: hypothetical protein AAF318_15690 [Pseudomonadota bacterium]